MEPEKGETMRAAMSYGNRGIRYTALRHAGQICLAACLYLGLIQFGLMPWLGLTGQVVMGAVVASLALQGVVLMLIVSLGRVRYLAVRGRARDLELWRVRNVWRQPEVALASE